MTLRPHMRTVYFGFSAPLISFYLTVTWTFVDLWTLLLTHPIDLKWLREMKNPHQTKARLSGGSHTPDLELSSIFSYIIEVCTNEFFEI